MENLIREDLLSSFEEEATTPTVDRSWLPLGRLPSKKTTFFSKNRKKQKLQRVCPTSFRLLEKYKSCSGDESSIF